MASVPPPGTVYIVQTMDVEPTIATTAEGASGPPDWEYGRKAVLAFWRTCQESHVPATFFLHPEAIEAQADLFRDLEQQGATLGLHLHPQKWSSYKHGGAEYFKDFGLLDDNEVVALLTAHITIFQDAFGHHPLYFRPGTFSFNDRQFAILEQLGFLGGSVSAPGRIAPHKSAVWAGAELDPHHANNVFRMTAGASAFVEVPMSVDTSRLLTSGPVQHYSDLRADTDWAVHGTNYEKIATDIIAQMQERNPAIWVLVSVLHNDEQYFNPEDPYAKNMVQSLGAQIRACRNAGLTPVGATIATIVEMATTALVRKAPEVSLQSAMY